MKVLLFSRGRFMQYFAAIYGNFGVLCYSLLMGCLSTNVLLLKSCDTPLKSGPLSTSQVSLIGSITYLIAIPGSLIFGWLSDFIGRKWSIYIGMVLHLMGFLLLASSSNFETIVVSRCMHGIAFGSAFVVAPVYVSEIAEKEIRGILGSIFNMFLSVGVLLSRIICPKFSFHVNPYVFITIICSFFVGFLFVYESPQFLLLRGREEAALESLKFFRGIKKDQELPDKVRDEYELLKNSPTLRNQEERITWDDFKSTSIRKALCICIVAYFGKFMNGCQVIVAYIGYVFIEMNTKMDLDLAAIITSIFAIVAALLDATILVSWGRKISIVSSALSTALLYIPVIILLMFNQTWEVPGLLIAMLLGLMTFTATPGLVCLPMQISAEILPLKLRSKVSSFNVMLTWFGMFTTSNYFLVWSESLGMEILFCIFCLWCVFEGIFLWKVMPETKGKTYDEIAKEL